MRKPSTSGSEKPTCSFSRFSLRRLLYASPLLTLRRQRSSKSSKHNGSTDNQSTFHDIEKGVEALPSTSPRIFSDNEDPDANYDCPLCYAELKLVNFPKLISCPHRSCLDCLQQYLRIEISESRICITCPECPEFLHPNDIYSILNDQVTIQKYEEFMVRRVLSIEPDSRWCPTPDCGFAVIASGCASCPKIKCERPGCDSYFCYHCKAAWHPNQTCDAARAQRSPAIRSSSVSFSLDSQNRDDLKACPRCQVLILKMDDGSCNHMTCAVCGAQFCWLCLKEISDLHYLSPSGCTFWGTKPWSRKKKILWQLGTLVGAPVGIALVAGIAIPAMIIGIPVWVGRKLYTRYDHLNKYKRNIIVTGGVVTSVLVAPVLAGLAVGIGVPILLFYVYGVVPVSLCRSGGCGVSTSSSGVRFDFDDEENLDFLPKAPDADAVSHPNISIGEAASLGSALEVSDKDSVSMIGLTGSIASNTRSVVNKVDQENVSVNSVKNTNDDGVSERVRFDDNVSIIEHKAVASSPPRNRVSSTLRNFFFKTNNNNLNNGNMSSQQDTSKTNSKRQFIMKKQKKPKQSMTSSSTTTISNNSSESIKTKTDKQNRKILLEVTLNDLNVVPYKTTAENNKENIDTPKNENNNNNNIENKTSGDDEIDLSEYGLTKEYGIICEYVRNENGIMYEKILSNECGIVSEEILSKSTTTSNEKEITTENAIINEKEILSEKMTTSNEKGVASKSSSSNDKEITTENAEKGILSEAILSNEKGVLSEGILSNEKGIQSEAISNEKEVLSEAILSNEKGIAPESIIKEPLPKEILSNESELAINSNDEINNDINDKSKLNKTNESFINNDSESANNIINDVPNNINNDNQFKETPKKDTVNKDLDLNNEIGEPNLNNVKHASKATAL